MQNTTPAENEFLDELDAARQRDELDEAALRLVLLHALQHSLPEARHLPQKALVFPLAFCLP